MKTQRLLLMSALSIFTHLLFAQNPTVNFENQTHNATVAWEASGANTTITVTANPHKSTNNNSNYVLKVANTNEWAESAIKLPILPANDSWKNYTHVSFKVYPAAPSNTWGQIQIANWKLLFKAESTPFSLIANDWTTLTYAIPADADNAEQNLFIELRPFTYYIDDIVLTKGSVTSVETINKNEISPIPLGNGQYFVGNDATTYRVIDMNGAILLNGAVNNGQIDLSKLNRGVYLLHTFSSSTLLKAVKILK